MLKQKNMNETKKLINSEEIENYDKNDRFIAVFTEWYHKIGMNI